MNKRQRELLIAICEKVAVYALTAGLLGRLFGHEIATIELAMLGAVSAIVVIGGYQIAKGVN